MNKLEKLSETDDDESDMYEDSKCHNIEFPIEEHKLPEMTMPNIIFNAKRNSTAESHVTASHRVKNPYRPENLEAIKNFVSASNSPRIQTLMKANLGRQL